jgi:aryl-phospho-beta-D-glucosidase BglC (GH1 family)
MKKLLHYAALLTLLILIPVLTCACSGSDSPDSDVDFVVPESIINTGLAFTNSGGTQTFSFQGPKNATVTSSATTWCSVTASDPTANGVRKVEVTAQPNTSTDIRTATITISCGSVSKNVAVTQSSADALIIKNVDYSPTLTDGKFSAAGGQATITVTTNDNIDATTDATWITEIKIVRGSLPMADAKVLFSIAKNSGYERTGTITIKLNNLVETVSITQAADENAGKVPDNVVDIAKWLGMGWNLGNQMDANSNGVSSETAWGNPVATQALFTKLKAMGYSTVRIPVTWLGHIGAAPNYTIEESWLNRVAEIVGYAENAGLNAIVNIHHDGADTANWLNIKDAATNSSTDTTIKNQIKAMWTQIANKFKEKGTFLIFETFNEIQDGGWGWGDNRTDGGKQYTVLNEWNQTAVDAIRATGGANATRYIGVPGYSTNADLTIDYLKLPTDPANHLLVAIHFYDYYEYTLNNIYSEWGHTGKSGVTYANHKESDVVATLDKIKAAFIDKGTPVYFGEIGCVRRDTDRAESFRKYYLEYVIKAATDRNIPCIYWDNGSFSAGKECSGLYDRTTGDYMNDAEDVTKVMIKAATSTDASYTLESVYNSAPK